MRSRWAHAIAARLKAIFRPRRTEQDLDDELAFHMAMQARANEQQGMSGTEARRRAHLDRLRVLEHPVDDLFDSLRFFAKITMRRQRRTGLGIGGLPAGLRYHGIGTRRFVGELFDRRQESAGV